MNPGNVPIKCEVVRLLVTNDVAAAGTRRSMMSAWERAKKQKFQGRRDGPEAVLRLCYGTRCARLVAQNLIVDTRRLDAGVAAGAHRETDGEHTAYAMAGRLSRRGRSVG